MSDYIYMLESHLSPDQNRAVEEVQTAAGAANVNVFLTGGAMRDMMAGFRIRDLDFVVEGSALKIAKAICDRTGAATVSTDDLRKSAELLFPSGVTAQIGTSHQEKFAKVGAKPTVTPATIQEDLRGRDFTCNAIALSLNRASRGLLLDPMNGLADLERKELRAVTTYGFYDDPTRLLRLMRFKVRLGFTIEERTQMQVANAREAETEKRITAQSVGEELKRIGAEDSPNEIFQTLAEAGLLALFSTALSTKLNTAGLTKYEKAIRVLPDDTRWRAARFGTFMYCLNEKLSPKEKQALIKATELSKSDADVWQKLETHAKKLEAALRTPSVRKPSHIYHIVANATPEDVLFVLYHSTAKPVQERLRTYFEKLLPTVQEITPEEWATIDVKPGTPKFAKAREEFLNERLNRKPPKPVEEDPLAVAPPPVPEPVVGRRGGR
jgi:tRNA nucleotidyltransferase (CCA-adding enzyme)